MLSIKRALISVSDKTGVEVFAKFLYDNGVEIISTSGTRKLLTDNNIPTTDITEVTGNPECFGGRVKTLDYKVLSSLLFDREKDQDEAKLYNIEPIDLLVCNFYPFDKVKNSYTHVNELIQNIDIGGVTLVRSAAKNFHGVTVVSDPSDYHSLMDELLNNNISISFNTRQRMMVKAFQLVACYDSSIATSMSALIGESNISINISKYKTLRYGENPHQVASMYRNNEVAKGESLLDQKQLSGKELSYNNVLDLESAIKVVASLNNNACCIVKHNTPCGVASTKDQDKLNLLSLAWSGDPVSAFGSVIAFNCKVDKQDLLFLDFHSKDRTKRKFVEIIAATGFTDEALLYLMVQKNLRIIVLENNYLKVIHSSDEMRFIPGGVLVQTADKQNFKNLECVTKENFLDINLDIDLVNFGIESIKQIKSNAISIVRKCNNEQLQMIGQGCGQPNRLNSIKLAIDTACRNLNEQGENIEKVFNHSILISEAFFPFSDNIEYCATKGVKIIIQPGGSIKDQDVIDACNKFGISMYFTGTRHFKH